MAHSAHAAGWAASNGAGRRPLPGGAAVGRDGRAGSPRIQQGRSLDFDVVQQDRRWLGDSLIVVVPAGTPAIASPVMPILPPAGAPAIAGVTHGAVSLPAGEWWRTPIRKRDRQRSSPEYIFWQMCGSAPQCRIGSGPPLGLAYPVNRRNSVHARAVEGRASLCQCNDVIRCYLWSSN